MSLDVQNLLTSILPTETLRLLVKNVNPVIIREILNTLETRIDQNYFIINNSVCSSNEGLLMRKPLYSIWAEILIDDTEKIVQILEFHIFVQV